MTTQNQAADRWAADQATAREIVDALELREGELIAPWASDDEAETQLTIGDSTVAEIRALLPTGWIAETDSEGLVLAEAPVESRETDDYIERQLSRVQRAARERDLAAARAGEEGGSL